MALSHVLLVSVCNGEGALSARHRVLQLQFAVVSLQNLHRSVHNEARPFADLIPDVNAQRLICSPRGTVPLHPALHHQNVVPAVAAVIRFNRTVHNLAVKTAIIRLGEPRILSIFLLQKHNTMHRQHCTDGRGGGARM